MEEARQEEEKKAEPEKGARKEQPEEETESEYSEEDQEEQEEKSSAAGPGIKLGPSPQPGSQRVKTPRPCPKNGRQCANTKQAIKQQILTQCQGTSSTSS